MKTSRILIAWLLSVAIFGVFDHFASFEVKIYQYFYNLWLKVTAGNVNIYSAAEQEVASRLAMRTGSLVTYCPAMTMSFIVFAHVIPNRLVISLRGILVAVAVVAVCLALAAIDVIPGTAWPTWLFCAFSAAVTVAGLAWLCWQGRRTGSTTPTARPMGG